jgi:hypothetical protein
MIRLLLFARRRVCRQIAAGELDAGQEVLEKRGLE